MTGTYATSLIHPNHAEMGMYPTEEMIRIHEKERRAEAERQREARSISAGRGWRAIARYATKKAEAAEQR
ncbi:hypothetical protein EIL87_16530 [Saccharopolyspora rhizosphaerae]|uniref:Uncharacterized protein n=1 Tax=Saccharopolyspora rhizosphaerae TaxID=2492662 RepID=A0A3R8P377_9PSEU|nr:hypothetical protein [Saccharopolyspora rhizosphaerae]RRO15625.1 hypothetical protein EIL87_16530 [Saccharopolyspora rhizosphaerae]